MKTSLLYYPDDPYSETLAIAREADRIGLDTIYFADSPYRKDPWILMSGAAQATERIRIGPNVAPIIDRGPFQIAKALATLDEVSGGRVDAVIGLGTKQGQSGSQAHSVARLREGYSLIEQVLTRGRIRHSGEFYSYEYDAVDISARPIQKHIPMAFGLMGGPRATAMAGEIADGVHVAPAHTSEACRYVVERARSGAIAAGRDPNALDIAVAPIWACSDSVESAYQVARIQTAFYVRLVNNSFLQAQGANLEQVSAIRRMWMKGDYTRAVELTSRQLVDMFAIYGTPVSCAEKAIRNISGTGVNHIVLMVADPLHAELLTGISIADVPSIREQLQIMSEYAIPMLKAATY